MLSLNTTHHPSCEAPPRGSWGYLRYLSFISLVLVMKKGVGTGGNWYIGLLFGPPAGLGWPYVAPPAGSRKKADAFSVLS